MPHRTTYFFPRQFPDRGFDSFSHKNDHEKKSSSNVAESFGFERDNNKSRVEDPIKEKETLLSSSSLLSKSSAVSDLFTGGIDDHKSEKKQQQQLAAFYEWLAEKKANLSRSSNTGRVKHTRLSMSSDVDVERELLLSPADPIPPLPASSSPDSIIAASSSSARGININERNIDRSFDREVSLPRMSSESSFAGSFFSGTTVDGNFSSFSSPTDARDTSTTTRVSVTKEEEEVEVRDDNKEKSLAQKSLEGYYLQVTLARRLISQANLANCDSVHIQSTETISYRFWV